MINVWAWVAMAIGPLAKRVLIALGIGWVSYQGAMLLFDQVKGAVLSNWGAMGGATAAIVNYFGFSEAVGIILGAIAARAALGAVARLGKVTA
jgi:hypothetical protein